MDDYFKQRVCVEFCYKLGCDVNKTLRLVNSVYSDNKINKFQCSQWLLELSRVQAGETETNLQSYLDPVTEIVYKAIVQDPRCKLDNMSFMLQVTEEQLAGVIENVLELGYLCGRLVPKKLSSYEMDRRLEESLYFRRCWDKNPNMLNRIITGDEVWLHTTKSLNGRSHSKVLLIVFFNNKELVHMEFVPRNTKVDAEFYCEVLNRLIAKANKKKITNWILHHDMTQAHSASIVNDLLLKSGIEVLHYPPNSPDLVPMDFFLIPKIQKRIENMSPHNICSEVRVLLESIDSEEFDKAFKEWHNRVYKCITEEGNYFQEPCIILQKGTVHKEEVTSIHTNDTQLSKNENTESSNQSLKEYFSNFTNEETEKVEKQEVVNCNSSGDDTEKDLYQEHVVIQEPILKCTLCSYSTKKFLKMKYHLMKEHIIIDKKKLNKILDKIQNNEINAQNHPDAHIPFYCTACKVYVKWKGLEPHYCNVCGIQLFRQINKSFVREKVESQKMIPLEYCLYTKKVETALELDNTSTNNGENSNIPTIDGSKFKCSMCPYQAHSEHGVKIHISVKHKKTALLSTVSEDYQCGKCLRKYESENQLKVHKILCQIDYLKCELCTFCTSSLNKMKSHVASDHGDKILDHVALIQRIMDAGKKYLVSVCKNRQQLEL
ncbi:hypothetical protein TKK_0001249 [Trichogramma kaykai]|uniref:C2H2-type domain-containing protein n=1 Tax=Trichogramma kaykai TaxID=54128 RepID=A0ABD2WWI1_9HYME